VSIAGLISLVLGLWLSAGAASAQSICGRDWTVGSACPISGPNVSVTGRLVAVNETDYYVFHAAANTQIKLTIADRQSRVCVAKFACAPVDADLYDRAGDEDYLEASTADLANNSLTDSSAPYILQTAGTYYLRVSAEGAEVPYRVRIVTSPGVTIPGSHAARASATGSRPAHHSGGDSVIGGLIVLAVLGLIVRAVRRGLRRRRDGSAQDARAYADWKRIQGRLPSSWPPNDRLPVAGRVVEHYKRVPKGVKVYMKFGPGSPRRDTFWKNDLSTPAVGQWVIFDAHMVDMNTHSGDPYLRADRILETFPADIERHARAHERWLNRQARSASAGASGPSAQEDNADGHQEQSDGAEPHDPGDGPPPPNSTDGRPDWAFEELDLGVSADLKEVSARRRDMAARYHPDRAASTTPEIRELAAERLKSINAAYEAIARWLNSQAASA
jgi:DnaJ-domain-containing protein 1